ncbi:MAG: hypothetical protein JSR21_04565 [Proteobacteria bacterium]|nr:hypothetical protein [Pseudomonadota bacterium]
MSEAPLDVAKAAALLEAARAEHRVRREPPPGAWARTPADGVAVQHARAGLRGALPPAGFKIGATGARMQQYLGVREPIGGFMEAANIHAAGAVLPFAGFVRPGVECEIAVRLAHDLPPGPCDAARAAAAVGAVMAGIEIVESRYEDSVALGVPMLEADMMFHAAAVLGAPVADWRGLDLKALIGRITVGGTVAGEGAGRELLGDPMACLAWLAASPLAARFGGLRAGQVVMLGSVTPPVWLDAPCAVEVAFPPLPPATLTFS